MANEVPKSHRLLNIVLWTVWCLNLVDALNTHTSGDYEMNPIMRAAYSVHPSVFFMAKLSMCTIGVYSLWRLRKEEGTMLASLALLLMFGLTVALQMIVRMR